MLGESHQAGGKNIWDTSRLIVWFSDAYDQLDDTM